MIKKMMIDYDLYDDILDGFDSARKHIWQSAEAASTQEEYEYWMENFHTIQTMMKYVINKSKITHNKENKNNE